jgi:hypothetical protein
MDPQSRITVKMEDIRSPLEAKVWVNFQGDRYMSLGGIEYVLTPSFEHMNRWGHLLPKDNERGAQTEPNHGLQNKAETQGPAPSAPPMPPAETGVNQEVNSGRK